MSTPEDPRPALAALEHDLAEASRLDGLIANLREQADTAAQETAMARATLGKEAADVERLERTSFARVWASLRGDAAERLERERAEEQAARYRLEVAVARHRAVEERVAETATRRARLGDVAARHAEHQDAVHAWVMEHGGPTAEALTETTRRVAQLEAEQTEVREAIAAADAAQVPLAEAARLLESAGGWSTYDTFFGGGILADLAKRDRMDAAAQRLRDADIALRYLSAELSDLGHRAAYSMVLSDGLHAFDLWFDDIFSSWAVHNRIGDAQQKVTETQRAVGEVTARLTTQAAEVAAELSSAAARRAELLRG